MGSYSYYLSGCPQAWDVLLTFAMGHPKRAVCTFGDGKSVVGELVSLRLSVFFACWLVPLRSQAKKIA